MRTNDDALYFADPEHKKDLEYIGILADAYPLGDIWRRNRPITTANIAHKAMRSKEGLLTLAAQSRTSILGNPIILRVFLVSPVELGCLADVMAEIEKKQKKGIVDALRTVMAWYGVGVAGCAAGRYGRLECALRNAIEETRFRKLKICGKNTGE